MSWNSTTEPVLLMQRCWMMCGGAGCTGAAGALAGGIVLRREPLHPGTEIVFCHRDAHIRLESCEELCYSARMRITRTKDELRCELAPLRGGRIVLVPTMGALHEGHASLLRQARELAGEQGSVVASVFLNPVQFDNASDLATYPQTPEEDLAVCESCGVDVVFMPTPEVMYCPDRSISLEETHLSTVLCGARRPGHFAGVCLVVNKLFNLVQPTDAIFGKKDYQQLAILRRLVRDMDIPVRLHGAEIVRGEDGLALSSRNVRLTPEHRAAAPSIRQSLLAAREAYRAGVPGDQICAQVRRTLEAIPGVKVDYAELVDAETLHELVDERRLALLAVAAYFGEVRLIDNIELTRA